MVGRADVGTGYSYEWRALTIRGERFSGHQQLRRRTIVRFNLLDLFFAIACFAIGMAIGLSFSSYLSASARSLAGSLLGMFIYFGLMYPFYRGLKLFPMILPRCPSCRKFQDGFHILEVCWPRVSFRCPGCEGRFVVWHDGKPGRSETWENPVLALRWPYALGIYRRARSPGPG